MEKSIFLGQQKGFGLVWSFLVSLVQLSKVFHYCKKLSGYWQFVKCWAGNLKKDFQPTLAKDLVKERESVIFGY